VRLARLPKTMKHRPRLKLVLLSLADYAHDDGSNAFPAVATIAAECESSPRTIEGVHGALATLKAAGFIELQEPAKQRRPAVWRLNLPRLAATAAPQHVAALVKNQSFKEATFQAAAITPAPQYVAALDASLEAASKLAQGRNFGTPDPQLSSSAPQNSSSAPQHVADDPVDPVIQEPERDPVSPSPEKHKQEPLAELRLVKRRICNEPPERGSVMVPATLEQLVDLAQQHIEGGYPADQLRVGVSCSMNARSLSADLTTVDEAIAIAIQRRGGRRMNNGCQ
jgi:hypothetical protein